MAAQRRKSLFEQEKKHEIISYAGGRQVMQRIPNPPYVGAVPTRHAIL